ncbi:MAG: hypothetical protein WC178_01245 [Candidatus Paceibacterota bacterium]
MNIVIEEKSSAIDILAEKYRLFQEEKARQIEVAEEIAVRLISEAVETMSDGEFEKMENGSNPVVEKLIEIPERDWTAVKVVSEGKYADLSIKSASEIIRDAAKRHIDALNNLLGQFFFEYSHKECCGNTFFLLISLKEAGEEQGKGGDK